ncbi:UNVERIFIED_CONTAM: Snakin-1 [Sesamum indicum]
MKSSLLLASLLLFAILLTNTFTHPTMAYSQYCNRSCGLRCARAGVKDRCLKYCGICCAKCKCVPSGTYGNKHQCPCYRDMRNSKGTPKCP